MSKEKINNKKNKELKRLEKIATHFSMLKGVNGRLEKYRIDIVSRKLKKGTVLDVGCADGVMAKALSNKFDVTGLDGSEKLIKRARTIAPKAKFIFSLFEKFKPKQKYDNVVLSFILEHVDNPKQLLQLTKEWVKDDGIIIILVPNAESIHRRVGKQLGMLKDLHDLNETDLSQGHRRVYDLDSLSREIENVGLKIIEKDGYFLKFLSEKQMEDWNRELLDAFYEVSYSMNKRLCMEIYAVCQK